MLRGAGLGSAVLALMLSVVSEGLGTALVFVGVPLAMCIPPVVGAVKLYESVHASTAEERRRVGVRVMPVLGVSPSGGWAAGLAGRF